MKTGVLKSDSGNDYTEKVLSVIIPSKNNGTTIGATILSVLRSKVPKGYRREIIVVDARSCDRTVEVFKKFKDHLKIVYDDGKGLGIARNMGIRYSTGDIICFVDADAIVSNDHFVKIVDIFEKHPEVDIIGVKGIPSRKLLKKLKLNKIGMLDLLAGLYGRIPTDPAFSKNPLASGCFISMRRRVVERILFWEYPPYGDDDTDFSYRARKKHFKIFFVKIRDSFAIPRQTLRDMIKQQIGYGKGKAYLLTKYLHDKEFADVVFKYKSSKNPLIGNISILLLYVLRCLLAPLGAIHLALKAKNITLIPYYIVRRYVALISILANIRKAMKYWNTHPNLLKT